MILVGHVGTSFHALSALTAELQLQLVTYTITTLPVAAADPQQSISSSDNSAVGQIAQLGQVVAGLGALETRLEATEGALVALTTRLDARLDRLEALLLRALGGVGSVGVASRRA